MIDLARLYNYIWRNPNPIESKFLIVLSIIILICAIYDMTKGDLFKENYDDIKFKFFIYGLASIYLISVMVWLLFKKF